ncbi:MULTISPECIES: flagellar biosynthesis protein FlhA [Bradyrhizobium]|jgi:flagellar biosynthesis protein FlhA|uniref:Flagellar biosynthesis protein FlhA n=5 Tax=Bradyrhizobium TaxID=374 RepID=A0ABS5GGZ0_9BRAD|nr:MULTISPECIES: flagellar biosynthesis protein FlhA [Bradyrhizobium]MBR1140613.1 flagellar biosynthesis protein FlhA [Bradyrhizobium denitrificans]MCL8484542.1 flagellar biosynthesis protein FlhA [Bradyrhizobium denitrificans]MDU1493115.1 flagellar biosynthesis protein FlhA [Bradyrhizobium sp.]MDU1543569.1 flagellar biosynthesis protein FlhA [Bradyrhizobium sp.]MDU1808255.1 flagellar biosynthesis protein FlhA [Bradyrhizobium sp.]
MVDVTAGQGAGSPAGGYTFGDFKTLILRGDIALALGILTILVVLILPLPAIVLDLFLAISITLSILILMTALFIQAPLEFSSFPTILLISTMLRLSLNLASTRLILSHGHEGTDAAGHVIQAFGSFVMGGNFVIGIIVFAILVTVNFVVITKGSGRIAEVAARFHLDSMPGKQMAIDADLSAGLIDEKVAKMRRKELEDESGFFGAMDGASKFVRGDAVAGLLVVFINIIGGIIIGVAQQGMSFGDAARSYTVLTVGDGLVTQVPALIVSTAAGLLVSKAGVSGAADKALMQQFSGYPQALGLSAAVMLVLALLPGIPTLPFLALGGGAAALAIKARRQKDVAKAVEAAEAAAPAAAATAAAAEEPIANALKIDDLKIELGYALLPLVNGPDGTDRLTDQIKALRRSLAIEMGFVMPSVRILDNVQLEANTYIIKIKEVDAGSGKIWPNQFMVMDPGGNQVAVPGIHTTEPTFGLPATWVDAGLKEEATLKGYTVVDAATVLSTHLTELLKANMSDLLSYGEVQKLLKELPKEQSELVKDIVPTQITISGIQRVLQLLLSERISIRDLSTILEGIADALAFSRNPATIVEHVRARLARQICAQNTSPMGYLPLIALSPKWEQAFAESLIGQGEERSLAMQPSKLSEFMTATRDAFERAAREGESPVLVTSAAIRPFVRSLVERFRAQTTVLSQAEIHPRARLKTVGSV